MSKQIEKFYLGTILMGFLVMIIFALNFDAIGWKVALPTMMVICIACIKAVKAWIKLFCNE